MVDDDLPSRNTASLRAGTTVPAVFDGSALAPRDRFDAWRETVSSAFVPLEASPRDPGAFDGTLVRQALGSISACEVGGDAVRVDRNRRTIARADPAVYKFALQVHGTGLVSQDDRQALLAPGDLAVYDTTRPYTLRFDGPYRMLVVQIPHELLGIRPDQARALAAERISGRSGLGALTSSLLTSLDAQLVSGGVDPDARATGAVLQLVQATLLQRIRPVGTVPAEEVVHLQALRHVDEHLACRDLTVRSVAAALHVSVRYLQKVFAREGTTVSECIRERRLQRCRIELAGTGPGSIAAVAMRWGYRDASSFTRAFRRAYGCTPSEFLDQTPASPR